MKTIKERAMDYAEIAKMRGDMPLEMAEDVYVEIATEQKAIDDANLAEVKRQRDEYYDELLKLRQQKIELIEWLKEEASRCREGARTGYDAYEIGAFEGQYTQAEDTIEQIKAMEE